MSETSNVSTVTMMPTSAADQKILENAKRFDGLTAKDRAAELREMAKDAQEQASIEEESQVYLFKARFAVDGVTSENSSDYWGSRRRVPKDTKDRTILGIWLVDTEALTVKKVS